MRVFIHGRDATLFTVIGKTPAGGRGGGGGGEAGTTACACATVQLMEIGIDRHRDISLCTKILIKCGLNTQEPQPLHHRCCRCCHYFTPFIDKP